MSTTTTYTGLVKPELTDPADITALNPNWDKIDEQLGNINIPVVQGVSVDGVLYVADTQLNDLKAGTSMMFIPQKTSTSVTVSIKMGTNTSNLYQSSSYATSTNLTPENRGWLIAYKPILLVYNGQYWKTVGTRASASDFYGILAPEKGGTGVNNLNSLKTKLGITNPFSVTPTINTAKKLTSAGYYTGYVDTGVTSCPLGLFYWSDSIHAVEIPLSTNMLLTIDNYGNMTLRNQDDKTQTYNLSIYTAQLV